MATTCFLSQVHGQWTPIYPIERLGFVGTAHTSTAGTQISTVLYQSNGLVIGSSERYKGTSDNGEDLWVWLNGVQSQAGLTGGLSTGAFGRRLSSFVGVDNAGQVIGNSRRYDGDIDRGQDTWVWREGVTTQIGLFGPAYADASNYQYSAVSRRSASGLISGWSDRIGVGSGGGDDIWVWDTLTTRQIGLVGGVYTGSSGFQTSEILEQNQAGQIAGRSRRIVGANTDNGDNVWVFNPLTNQHTIIGFVGAPYTGTSGYQISQIRDQNANGLVVGQSWPISGVNTTAGSHTWVWDGVQTTRIGLFDAAHTSSSGVALSSIVGINDAGLVAGFSRSYVPSQIDLGQDVWVAVNGVTTQTGLIGGANAGNTGYQLSSVLSLSGGLQAVGYSRRFTGFNTNNGENAWACRDGVTTQIGLVSAAHTGSAGLQNSTIKFHSAAGQVVGISERYSGVSTSRGRDAWVWDGAASIPLGLAGAQYTRSDGFQISDVQLQNATGQLVGQSRVFDPASGATRGWHAWVWNGGTTVRVGLTGPANTAPLGSQDSIGTMQNASGQVAGSSVVYSATGANNGQSSWVWNGTQTVEVGLSGGAFTGSDGYRFSESLLQSPAGHLVGRAIRFTGVNTSNGLSPWYFDPATNLVHDMFQGVADSVRQTDSYAFAQLDLLTQDGFALGMYRAFAGGVGAGEYRAFIYRPDFGFAALDAIVSGGIAAAGWSRLMDVDYASMQFGITGTGLASGQVFGSAAFLLHVPSPGTLVSCVVVAGIAIRRRRR